MARKQIKIILVLFAIIFAFQKCANQMSPPGGDDDKTPPTVIETFPENGTINFIDNYVEFSFSEYVNKNSIREAIFVSPIIDGALEYSWTNKTVTITFPDTLKQNTTYSIIVGTGVKDVANQNPMKAPSILTFSTGSKIDSGKISGKVYSSKPEGTLIFAYKDFTDTLDILEDKPSYISQVDEHGVFSLLGLGTGKYKVFAIIDEFKNNLYNIGEDQLGIQSKLIELIGSNDVVSNLNYFLEKEDTLVPHFQKVTMTDRNHFVIEFDEAIDSSKILVDNISVYDSTISKQYSLRKLFKGKKKNQYILGFTDSLNLENNLYLNATNISDINGNNLISESYSFIPSDKLDTNVTNIDRLVTKFERNTIDFLNPTFDIYFSDAFDTLNAKKGISLITRDSLQIPFEVVILDDASLRINITEKLKPKKEYFVMVNLNYFQDLAGNKIDTTISKRISTINKFDFTGAMGKVRESDKKNIKVNLQGLKRGGTIYQVSLEKNSTFKFERIVPGDYLIWVYSDEDSSGSYSYGSNNPFELAEKFAYYPDTLNLKARWPVGDIIVDFK
ncbi:MAG: Ig-like domain-containing protein [Melioribacteraceae bacterium]